MANKPVKSEKHTEAPSQPLLDENHLIRQRRKKAAELKAAGYPLFPNTFRPRDQIGELRERYERLDGAQLESRQDSKFTIAGRIMALRSFGKAAFLNLEDRTGNIQCHVQRDVCWGPRPTAPCSSAWRWAISSG